MTYRNQRERFELQALEPRVLLSAAPVSPDAAPGGMDGGGGPAIEVEHTLADQSAWSASEEATSPVQDIVDSMFEGATDLFDSGANEATAVPHGDNVPGSEVIHALAETPVQLNEINHPNGLSNAGTLEVNLKSSQSGITADQHVVTGGGILGGILKVIISGPVPPDGTEIIILQASNLTGRFDKIEGMGVFVDPQDSGQKVRMFVTFDKTSVTLNVQRNEIKQGDLNLDAQNILVDSIINVEKIGAEGASVWYSDGVQVHQYDEVKKITGGLRSNTLVGPDLPVSWKLNQQDSGSLQMTFGESDLIQFSGIQTLQGGRDTDVLTLQSDFGEISGGNGDDKFIFTIDGSPESIDGELGEDRIQGMDAEAEWTITDENKGTYVTTPFENIELLIGGAGGDTFTFSGAGRVTGLDGGDEGLNQIDTSSATPSLPTLVQRSDGTGSMPQARTIRRIDFTQSQGIGARIVEAGIPSFVEQGPGPILQGGVEMQDGRNAVAGAINVIAPHPFDPNIIFVGSVNGGVWRTLNGGQNWEELTDSMLSLSITSLVISPLDAEGNVVNATTSLDKLVVYAGTGQSSSIKINGFAMGLLRSRDGGGSWTVVGAPDLAGGSITSVVATGKKDTTDPASGEILFVSAMGQNGGVFRSSDGGETFERRLEGEVSSLVAQPGNPATLYAGVVKRGVFQSTNDGQDWADAIPELSRLIEVDKQDPAGFGYGARILIAVDVNFSVYVAEIDKLNQQIDRFYAYTQSNKVWTRYFPVQNAPDLTQLNAGKQGLTHFSLTADPDVPGVVYVAGDRPGSPREDKSGYGASIFRWKLDATGEEAWKSMVGANASGTDPHSDSRAMIFDAAGRLLEADDGGIYRLDVKASPWKWEDLVGDLRTAEVGAAAFDPVHGVIIGATQDNGLVIQPQSPNDSGDVDGDGVSDNAIDPFAWNTVYPDQNGGAGDGSGAVVIPLDTDNDGIYDASLRFVALKELGSLFYQRTDRSDEATWTAANLTLRSEDSRAYHYPLPLVVNLADGNRMLGGAKYLYESTNRFSDRNKSSALSIEVGGAHETFFTALAYGGYKGTVAVPDVIYAARGKEMWVRESIAPGEGWVRINIDGVEGADEIRDIVLDPENWEVAYAISQKGVYMTTTHGVSRDDGKGGSIPGWVSITGNLRDNLRTLELVTTVEGTRVLLVGGNTGVHRAIGSKVLTVGDTSYPEMWGGVTWTEFGANLPNAIVSDIRFVQRQGLPDGMRFPDGQAQNILLVATIGRGVFTLNVDEKRDVFAAKGVISATGGAEDNNFTISRDSLNPLQLTIAVNGFSFTVPMDSISQILLEGSDRNDMLTLDSGQGGITVPGGIDFDGKGGTNTITLSGTAREKPAEKAVPDDASRKQFQLNDVLSDGVQRFSYVVSPATSVDNNVVVATAVKVLGTALRATSEMLQDSSKSLEVALIRASLPRAINGSFFNQDAAGNKAGQSLAEVASANEPNTADLSGEVYASVLSRMIENAREGFSLLALGSSISSMDELVHRLDALDNKDDNGNPIPGNMGNVTLDTNSDQNNDGVSDTTLRIRIVSTLDGQTDLELGVVEDGVPVDVNGLMTIRFHVTLDLTLGVFGVNSEAPAGGLFVLASASSLTITGMELLGVNASGDFKGVDAEVDPSKTNLMLGAGLEFEMSFGSRPWIELDLLDSDPDFGAISIVPSPGGTSIQLAAGFVARSPAENFEQENAASGANGEEAEAEAEGETATPQDGPAAAEPVREFSLNFNFADATSSADPEVELVGEEAVQVFDLIKAAGELAPGDFITRLISLKNYLDAFGAKAPFVGKTVTDLFNVLDTYQAKVLDVIAPGGVPSSQITSMDELAQALADSIGVPVDQVGPTLDIVRSEVMAHLHLPLQVSEGEKTDAIDFGIPELATAIGFLAQYGIDVALEGSGALTINLGLDMGDMALLADGASLDSVFFLRASSLTASAGITVSDLNLDLEAGPITLGLDHGSVEADVTMEIELVDPTPDGEQLSWVDLQNTKPDNLGSLREIRNLGGLAQVRGVEFGVAGFLLVQGDFGFELSNLNSVALSDRTGIKDARLLAIGAGDLQGWVGVNGPATNAGALGFTVDVENFGLAVIRENNETENAAPGGGAPGEPARIWAALAGHVNHAAFVGTDPIQLQADDLDVRINTTASDGTSVDFTQIDADGFDGPEGSLAIPGAEAPLDFTAPIVRAEGKIDLNLDGFVSLTGTMGFEKGELPLVPLSDKTTLSNAHLLTIGASELTGFVGVNGPATNDKATGFTVTVDQFAFALIKPSQTGAADNRVWAALSARISSPQFVGKGFEDLDFTVQALLAEVNTAASDGTYIDFTQIDRDSDGNPDKGLAIAGASEPLILSSPLTRVGGTVTLHVSGLIYLSGSLIFEKSETSVTPSGTGTALTYTVLTIGARDVQAFVGLGGPYFVDSNQDGVIDANDIPQARGAAGLVIDDFDFALALLNPVDPGNPARYYALQASVNDARFIGVDAFEASISNLQLSLNQVTGAADGAAAIDFTKLQTNDPNGTAGAGLVVRTGPGLDEFLRITFAEELLRVSAYISLTISNFAQASGNFAFNAPQSKPLTLSDGRKKQMRVMTVGASDVDAFAGVGPYFVDSNGDQKIDDQDTPDKDHSVGVTLTGGALALVLMQPEDASDKAVYYAVRAAGSAGTVGLETPKIEVENLVFEINGATGPAGNPVVDFPASYPDDHGLPVDTGTGQTQLIDATGSELQAAGYLTVQIGDFVYASGSFAIQQGGTLEVTPAGGTTSKTVSVLELGAQDIKVFAGTGGPYWVDSDHDGKVDATPQSGGATGVVLQDLDFAMVLMRPDDPTDAARYYAIMAQAESVDFIGMDDFNASAKELSLSVNGASDGNPAIDFTKINATAPDGTAVQGLVVARGSGPGDYRVLSFSGEVEEAAGSVTMNISGFVSVTGEFAFRKGEEKEFTLADATKKTMEIVTIGASNVNIFAGVGGPYFIDSNGDGVIDANDTPAASGAMGVTLENLHLAAALMRPKPQANASQDLTRYYAVTAGGAAALIGVDGVSLSAEQMTIEINGAKDDNDEHASPSAINFGASPLVVQTGPDSNETFSFSGSLLQLRGTATVAIAEYVYASGEFFFEAPGEERQITLTDPNTSDSTPAETLAMKTLELAVGNGSAFVGSGGPVFSDPDGDGKLTRDDTGATGLVIENLSFALALFKPGSLENGQTDPRSFYAIKASLAQLDLIGVRGVTISALNLDLSVNSGGGGDRNTGAVVDFKATYGPQGLSVGTEQLDFDQELLEVAGSIGLDLNFDGGPTPDFSLSATATFERATGLNGAVVTKAALDDLKFAVGDPEVIAIKHASALLIIGNGGLAAQVAVPVKESISNVAFTADLSLAVNTTDQAVNQTFTFRDGTTQRLTLEKGPYLRLAATNLDLEVSVAGVDYTLHGDFQFEQFEKGGQKVVRVAAANVGATVGGGTLANGSGGLLIYSGNSDSALNGIAGQLKGTVTGSTLNATADAEIALVFNNTSQKVHDTISLNGADLTIDALANTFDFALINATLSFGDVARLTGDFLVNPDGNDRLIGARNVELFLGEGPLRLDGGALNPAAVGVWITNASFAAWQVGGGSFAVFAYGEAQLLGLDGLVLSGSMGVKINRTGQAVNKNVSFLDGGTMQLNFDTGDYIEQFTAGLDAQGNPSSTSLATIVGANVFKLQGAVSVTRLPSGQLDVNVPDASLSIQRSGADGSPEEAFGIDGAARFSIGGGQGFQLQDIQVKGFSIFGFKATLPTSTAPPRPPVSELAQPLAGAVISVDDLNKQGYIDVVFRDLNGEGLDAASITDSEHEIVILGDAAANVVLDGGQLAYPNGDTRIYRYTFNGQFQNAAGSTSTVQIQFQPGTFKDKSGASNQAATEQFFLYGPSGGGTAPPPAPPTAVLSSPLNGAFVHPDTINAQRYLDVTFNVPDGWTLDETTLDGNEFQLSGAGAAQAPKNAAGTTNAGFPQFESLPPTKLSGTTYRYTLAAPSTQTQSGTDGSQSTLQPIFVSGPVQVDFAANSWAVKKEASQESLQSAASSSVFTVDGGASGPVTDTGGKQFSVGPLSLSAPRLTLAGLHYHHGALVITVALGLGSVGLHFGAGKPGENKQTGQDSSGISASLTGILGKFDVAVPDVLGLIANPSSIRVAVTGKFSLDIASFDIKVPDVFEASGTGIEFAYDPNYDKSDPGNNNRPQQLLSVDSATISFDRFGVSGNITDLVVTESGFGFKKVSVTKDTAHFGNILDLEQLTIGLDAKSGNFSVDFSHGLDVVFNGSIFVSSESGTFLKGRTFSATISDSNNDKIGIYAALTFKDGKVEGVEFDVDNFTISLGSYLTLIGQGISIHSDASADQDLVSINKIGARLKAGSLLLTGEATNFGYKGDGSFDAKEGFGVVLEIGSAADGGAFQWPSWLPIRITTIGIEWKDIKADPTDFVLILSAAVTGIQGLPLTFTGAVSGVKIDVGKLLEGKFPIVDIGGIAVGVSGNAFGGVVDGTLIGGMLKLDENGNMIPADSTTEPTNRILFLGVEGGFQMAGTGGGLRIRFALSELGPLGLNIYGSVPGGIVLEPDTGIAINDLNAGIEFFRGLPDIQSSDELNRPEFKGLNGPISDAGAWLTTVQQQVVLQHQRIVSDGLPDGAGFLAAFTAPMILSGSVKLLDAYVTEETFYGEGDFALSTDGKFYFKGTIATLGGSLSISAALYVDMSHVLQGGKASVFFLGSIPDQIQLLTVGGRLTMGFITVDSTPVPFPRPGASVNAGPSQPLAALFAPGSDGTIDGALFQERKWAVDTQDTNPLPYIDVIYQPRDQASLMSDSIVDADPEFTLVYRATPDGPATQLQVLGVPTAIQSAYDENGFPTTTVAVHPSSLYRYKFTAPAGGLMPGTYTVSFIDGAWSDSVGPSVVPGADPGQTFTVTGPTAQLAGAFNGGSIDIGLLAAERWIDVQFTATQGGTLSEIDGNELRLTTPDGQTVTLSLDASQPPDVATGVYRYIVPDNLVLKTGPYKVVVVAGTFSDSNGFQNLAGTGLFEADGPSGTLLGFNGDVIGLSALEQLGFVDVSYQPSVGAALDQSSVDGDELQIRLESGSVAKLGLMSPQPAGLPSGTYRYVMPHLQFEAGTFAFEFLEGAVADTASYRNIGWERDIRVVTPSADLADPIDQTNVGVDNIDVAALSDEKYDDYQKTPDLEDKHTIDVEFHGSDDSNSPLLAQRDVTDWAGWAAALHDQKTDVSLWLYGKLSTATQGFVDAAATGTEITVDFQNTLLGEINGILQGSSIYAAGFASVNLSQGLRTLGEWSLAGTVDPNNPHPGPPAGNDLIRLNRLLLEQAFPSQIGSAHRLNNASIMDADAEFRLWHGGSEISVTGTPRPVFAYHANNGSTGQGVFAPDDSDQDPDQGKLPAQASEITMEVTEFTGRFRYDIDPDYHFNDTAGQGGYRVDFVPGSWSDATGNQAPAESEAFGVTSQALAYEIAVDGQIKIDPAGAGLVVAEIQGSAKLTLVLSETDILDFPVPILSEIRVEAQGSLIFDVLGKSVLGDGPVASVSGAMEMDLQDPPPLPGTNVPVPRMTGAFKFETNLQALEKIGITVDANAEFHLNTWDVDQTILLPVPLGSPEGTQPEEIELPADTFSIYADGTIGLRIPPNGAALTEFSLDGTLLLEIHGGTRLDDPIRLDLLLEGDMIFRAAGVQLAKYHALGYLGLRLNGFAGVLDFEASEQLPTLAALDLKFQLVVNATFTLDLVGVTTLKTQDSHGVWQVQRELDANGNWVPKTTPIEIKLKHEAVTYPIPQQFQEKLAGRIPSQFLSADKTSIVVSDRVPLLDGTLGDSVPYMVIFGTGTLTVSALGAKFAIIGNFSLTLSTQGLSLEVYASISLDVIGKLYVTGSLVVDDAGLRGVLVGGTTQDGTGDSEQTVQLGGFSMEGQFRVEFNTNANPEPVELDYFELNQATGELVLRQQTQKIDPGFRLRVGGRLQLGGSLVLQGQFLIALQPDANDEAILSIDADGFIDLDLVGGIAASGSLRLSKQGLWGWLSATVGANGRTISGTGFSIDASLLLELNTTGQQQTLAYKIFTLDDATGNIVQTDAPDQNFDPGFRLRAGGTMTISSVLRVAGEFLFAFDALQAEVTVHATGELTVENFGTLKADWDMVLSPDAMAVHAEFTGDLSEFGKQTGILLNGSATLDLNTGAKAVVADNLTIQPGFRLVVQGGIDFLVDTGPNFTGRIEVDIIQDEISLNLDVTLSIGDAFDLKIQAGVDIFTDADRGIALRFAFEYQQTLKVGAFEIFSLDTHGLLLINTSRSTSRNVDGTSIAAQTLDIKLNGSVNILQVLTVEGSGSLTLTGTSWDLGFQFSSNFFNVASVSGSADFKSTGDFSLTFDGGLDVGGHGFGLFGAVNLSISFVTDSQNRRELKVSGSASGEAEAFHKEIASARGEIEFDSGSGRLRVAVKFDVVGIKKTAHFVLGYLPAAGSIPPAPNPAHLDTDGTLHLLIGDYAYPQGASPGRNFALEPEPTAGSDWTPQKDYSGLSPTSKPAGGTPVLVDISVDASGTPSATITDYGSGYFAGDTLTFVPPDKKGTPLTIKLNAASDEFFTVAHVGGGSDGETVEVRGMGPIVQYAGVKKIAASGGDGDDQIQVLPGVLVPVQLSGDGGEDLLASASAGGGILDGGDGDDTLQGGAASETLTGGAGLDDITGGGGADTISGGDDIDSIHLVGDSIVIVSGDDGDDTIDVSLDSAGNIQVDAGTGSDTLLFEGTTASDDFRLEMDGAKPVMSLYVNGKKTLSLSGANVEILKVYTGEGGDSVQVSAPALAGFGQARIEVDLNGSEAASGDDGQRDTLQVTGDSGEDWFTLDTVTEGAHITWQNGQAQPLTAEIILAIPADGQIADTLIVDGGAGDDHVQIAAGADGRFAAALTVLSVTGGDGTDALATTLAQGTALTLWSSSMTFGGAITSYEAFEGISLDAVSSDILINNSYAASTTVNLQGGSVQIMATQGSVTLNLMEVAGGPDSSNIAKVAGAIAGDLLITNSADSTKATITIGAGVTSKLNGAMRIVGSATAEDKVIIDDSADSLPRVIAIGLQSAQTLSGLPFSGGGSPDISFIDSLELLLGTGDDAFQIASTSSPASSPVGSLVLNGGAGNDQLIAVISGENQGSQAAITAQMIEVVTYTVNGLDGGSWSLDNSTLSFGAPPSRQILDAGQPLSLTLNLGAGADSISICSSDNSLVLNSGAGDDAITVPNLAAITGATTLDAGGDAGDKLNFSDPSSDGDVARTFTLDAGVVSMTIGPPPPQKAPSILNYAGATSATLNLGGAEDTVVVGQTGIRFVIDPGTGENEIQLPGGNAALTVTAKAGTQDTLTIDRSTITKSLQGSVTDKDGEPQIEGADFDISTVMFLGIDRLKVNLGSGNDSFTFDYTGTANDDTVVEIDGGPGDDSFLANNVPAAGTEGPRVEANGGIGNDSMTLMFPDVPAGGEFDSLGFDAEKLIVDHSGGGTGVDWTVKAGALKAGAVTVALIQNTPVVELRGGTSNLDTLTIASADGTTNPVNVTVTGNQIEFIDGQAVLTPGGFANDQSSPALKRELTLYGLTDVTHVVTIGDFVYAAGVTDEYASPTSTDTSGQTPYDVEGAGDTINIFKRVRIDGKDQLTLIQSIRDGSIFGGKPLRFLQNARDLVLSPDGAFLFVGTGVETGPAGSHDATRPVFTHNSDPDNSATSAAGIFVFARDAHSGRLTPMAETFTDRNPTYPDRESLRPFMEKGSPKITTADFVGFSPDQKSFPLLDELRSQGTEFVISLVDSLGSPLREMVKDRNNTAEQLADQLAAAFNDILERVFELYSVEGVTMRDETKALYNLVKGEMLGGVYAALAGRMLLEDAFPGEIRLSEYRPYLLDLQDLAISPDGKYLYIAAAENIETTRFLDVFSGWKGMGILI